MHPDCIPRRKSTQGTVMPPNQFSNLPYSKEMPTFYPAEPHRTHLAVICAVMTNFHMVISKISSKVYAQLTLLGNN